MELRSIDFADPTVTEIRDVQIPRSVDAQAARRRKFGQSRLAAVA